MDVPYVLFVPILSIMFLSLFFISYFVILLIFSYSMTIKKLAKPLCLFLFFLYFYLHICVYYLILFFILWKKIVSLGNPSHLSSSLYVTLH